MSKEHIVNIKEDIQWMEDHDLQDNYYVCSKDGKCIRSVMLNHEQWFEVDQEPLMYGCYEFSSKSLAECCEFVGVLYFNQ